MLLKANQQAELEVSTEILTSLLTEWYCPMLSVYSFVLLYQTLEVRVREEQKMMDKKIVAEMDQKVIDQQNTLEKAGVPGFYVTTNPQVS